MASPRRRCKRWCNASSSPPSTDETYECLLISGLCGGGVGDAIAEDVAEATEILRFAPCGTCDFRRLGVLVLLAVVDDRCTGVMLFLALEDGVVVFVRPCVSWLAVILRYLEALEPLDIRAAARAALCADVVRIVGRSLALLAEEAERCRPLSIERVEGESDLTESVSGSDSGVTFVESRNKPVCGGHTKYSSLQTTRYNINLHVFVIRKY